MDGEIYRAHTSLGADINKAHGGEQESYDEEVIFPFEDVLDLKKPDEELLLLKDTWVKEFMESPWGKWDTEARDYYLGKSYAAKMSTSERPLTNNMIFEAVETSLPQITGQEPEPVVIAGDTPDEIAIGRQVKDVLVDKADTQRWKMKIRRAARHWYLYKIGIIQMEWNDRMNDFEPVVVNPKTCLLDPKGRWEGVEFNGDWMIRTREANADTLSKIFSSKKDEIKKYVQNKMMTKVKYHECWTNDYVFWTFKDCVLSKKKNPHYNYPTEDTLENLDTGELHTVKVQARNHFKYPKKPFIGFNVFNLGESPIDDTGLVEQNLSTQDILNKRIAQVDKNVDSLNGGIVISGRSFNKGQSGKVSAALRKPDGVIFVPDGDIRGAVDRISAPSLPADVYNDVIQRKQDLRENFGITGFTPAGIQNEDTVRGKILVRGQDQSRMSPIAEVVEQVYDEMFNWAVQMMYVYYDEVHVIPVLGKADAANVLTIQNEDFVTRLKISVKEGSNLPKDPLTQRNEAIDLWNAGATDPITLFEKLDYPDPVESAKRLYMWQNQPEMLFPDLMPQQVPVEQPMMTETAPQVMPEADIATPNVGGSEDLINNLFAV
jgi:hypothetical protein